MILQHLGHSELCLTWSGNAIWFYLFVYIVLYISKVDPENNTPCFPSALWVSVLLKKNRTHKMSLVLLKTVFCKRLDIFLWWIHTSHALINLCKTILLSFANSLPPYAVPNISVASWYSSLFYWLRLHPFYSSVHYLISLSSYILWQRSRTGLLFSCYAYTVSSRAWLALQQTFAGMTE